MIGGALNLADVYPRRSDNIGLDGRYLRVLVTFSKDKTADKRTGTSMRSIKQVTPNSECSIISPELEPYAKGFWW